MNENVNENAITQATPAPDSGASGHIDPDSYAQLQAEVAQYRDAIQQLSPRAAEIQMLVEHPEYADLFKNAVKSYEAVRADQAPKVPEELKPLYDNVSRLSKLADEYENERKSVAEAPQREYQQKWEKWQHDPANEKSFHKITRDNPDLTPKDFHYLASVAAEDGFKSLDDVWAENSWRFVKPTENRPAPPSSLRSDAGEVGIPGESQNGSAPEKSLRERTIELERARFGKAS